MDHCQKQEHYALLISAAVDGALSPEEHRALMEHLALCPACRSAYEQTMLLHGAFADWEEPELPGDLTAAVMERVRAERPKSRRRPLRQFAAAAACLALIVYGARLMSQDRPDVAADSAPSEVSLTESDQEDALPGSVSEGTVPSAAPQVRAAKETPDEEQILEGVITYFNNAPLKAVPQTDSPEAEPQDDAQAADAQFLSVPTLSSSDPELLSWMTSNIAQEGYNSTDEANIAEATAWLINGEEYEALQVHIAEVSMEYKMDWGDSNAVMPLDADDQDLQNAEMICVVYIQAEEPET